MAIVARFAVEGEDAERLDDELLDQLAIGAGTRLRRVHRTSADNFDAGL
jgi:hypothetical protein